MENFIYYNPTKLYFGRGVINNLNNEIKNYGKKVLLVYGKGSIKKNGIYDKVIEKLKANNCEIFEYEGIKPNPIVEDVNAAAFIGRINKIDVIVAVGGGSVIDSAKIISITIPVDNNAWDFYSNKIKPRKAIPVISVLTLAATGTEMNPFAVIQNDKTMQKLGYYSPYIFPACSFLDPEFTYTVPQTYTAYGIADLIAHSLEAYFGEGDASLSDKICLACIKEAVEYGSDLLKNLDDYDLRAKIMYDATLALNGITINGRKSADWGAHDIAHVISVLFDVPHGAALTIVYPAWLKFASNIFPEKITKFEQEVFGKKGENEGIFELQQFFINIKCPTKLYDIGITDEKIDALYDGLILNKATGQNLKLKAVDYKKLIEFMR